jgi:hypothetical protein
MGQMRGALCFKIELFVFGSLNSFNVFERQANQIGSLQKKKIELERHLTKLMQSTTEQVFSKKRRPTM